MFQKLFKKYGQFVKASFDLHKLCEEYLQDTLSKYVNKRIIFSKFDENSIPFNVPLIFLGKYIEVIGVCWANEGGIKVKTQDGHEYDIDYIETRYLYELCAYIKELINKNK